MLLNEKFRVEHAASRSWQCRALAPLVLLGVACSLVTLQPARSADVPTDQADASQSAAENPVETLETGCEAGRRHRRGRGYRHRLCTAARRRTPLFLLPRRGRLLGETVPLSAARALAEPLSRLMAAGGAEEDDLGH